MSLNNELKKAFEENEKLKRPDSSVISLIVETFFSFTVTGIAICLFAPFSSRTTPANLILLILAVLLYISKKPRLLWKRAIFFWLIGAVLLFISSLMTFCVAPKPLYVAIVDSNNPFKSTLTYLKNEKATIGSIWILPNIDAVRKRMSSTLHRLFPSSIRLIEQTHYGDKSYYNIPILDNFTQDSRAKGDVAWKRSIYLPMTVFGKDVRLHIVNPNPFLYTTDKGAYALDDHLGFESLFYVAYIKYPELIPWNAVEVLDDEREKTLCYTACLDLGLEAIVAGKPGVAIQEFELATDYAPPKNLENARVSMLECLIIEENLGGNIGMLQALPKLHKAYNVFRESTPDPRFSKKDPLTNWIRNALLGGYGHWDWTTDFYERTDWLEQLPHVEDTERPYFREFDERLKAKDDKALISLAKAKDTTIAETYEIRDILFNRVSAKSKPLYNAALNENDPEKARVDRNNGKAASFYCAINKPNFKIKRHIRE